MIRRKRKCTALSADGRRCTRPPRHWQSRHRFVDSTPATPPASKFDGAPFFDPTRPLLVNTGSLTGSLDAEYEHAARRSAFALAIAPALATDYFREGAAWDDYEDLARSLWAMADAMATAKP